MDIEKSRVDEITALHLEIMGYLKQSLEKAIRIGELLTEQKKSLGHGEFTPWIKANLPFTARTARNYMRVFKERDRLKTETVSDLTSAYQLISGPTSGDVVSEAQASLRKAEGCHAEGLELQKLFDHFSDENSELSRDERLKGLTEVHNRAVKLESSAMETRLVADRELGKLLNSEEALQEVLQILNTDYYEFTPVGLKRHREPTKEEWREYGERLRLASGILDEQQSRRSKR